MKFLRAGEYDMSGDDDFIDAATLLTKRNPEFRPVLTNYLRDKFAEAAKSKKSPHYLLDAAWRGEFLELRPRIEAFATASADEAEEIMDEDSLGGRGRPTGKYQHARRILIAWSETDPVTRLKLDAIVESSSTHLFGVAPLLRREFDALQPDRQSAFLEFLRWLSVQKVWSNWRTMSVEQEFGLQPADPE
jgi:hypothetical protein